MAVSDNGGCAQDPGAKSGRPRTDNVSDVNFGVCTMLTCIPFLALAAIPKGVKRKPSQFGNCDVHVCLDDN